MSKKNKNLDKQLRKEIKRKEDKLAKLVMDESVRQNAAHDLMIKVKTQIEQLRQLQSTITDIKSAIVAETEEETQALKFKASGE